MWGAAPYVHVRTEDVKHRPRRPDDARMADNWLYLEATRDGHAYVASFRVPFDPARWPEFDHHVALVLRYKPHWRTGLPKPDELTRLQEFEDLMIDVIGDGGALVAMETSDMRRTIHLRLPAGELLDMYRGWVGQPDRVETTVEHDPEWRCLTHLSQLAAQAAA